MDGILNDISRLQEKYFCRDYVPENNNAFVVTRVSTHGQQLKSSPEIQDEGALRYAAEKSLNIREMFSIAETAFYPEQRKLFNEIISKIKKSHKTNDKMMHLIFSHASRASRNKKSTNELRSLVLDYGIVLHYQRDKLILHKGSDQATWDRWEKHHIVSEAANEERRMNSLYGMLKKYAKGIPLQHPPFGYKSVRITKEDSGYAFRPPYSSYMKRAFELAITGDNDFKSKLDEEFEGVIEKNKIPNSRRLLNALKDPFYYGDFKVKEYVYKGDPEFVPPLIKKSLWNRVQIILEERSRNTRPGSKNLTYTGTIKCGGDILDEYGVPTGEICRGSISGEEKEGKQPTWGCGCSRKNCSQRKAKYMKSIGHQRYYAEDKIDLMLLEIVKKINLTPEILHWFGQRVEETVWEQGDFNKSKYSQIQSNITKKQNLKKKLLVSHLSGSLSEAEFKELDQEIKDEIEELHKQKVSFENSRSEDDWIKAAVMEKITNLSQTFIDAPGYAKNNIIKTLSDKLILRHGEVHADLKSFLIPA